MCLFLHCVAVRCFPPKSSSSMHCTFSAQPCEMVPSNAVYCSNIEGKVLTMYFFFKEIYDVLGKFAGIPVSSVLVLHSSLILSPM